jgi:hypothetical protein
LLEVSISYRSKRFAVNGNRTILSQNPFNENLQVCAQRKRGAKARTRHVGNVRGVDLRSDVPATARGVTEV